MDCHDSTTLIDKCSMASSSIISSSDHKSYKDVNAWESFAAHVRRLNTTIIDNGEKAFSEQFQRTRNILLARPPSAAHQQVLKDMKEPKLISASKAVIAGEKIENFKSEAERQREIEERQSKARQGWSVLRKFIEEQKRRRKRQEQLNRWRMLDRLASRARSYQLRRELYVKYGVISSTTQKAQLQKPSKEMAMRVDQMISKFKETQFRPLTAPATSQPYRRTRARRNAHYIN